MFGGLLLYFFFSGFVWLFLFDKVATLSLPLATVSTSQDGTRLVMSSNLPLTPTLTKQPLQTASLQHE